MSERIALVGIGADGWAGLTEAARDRLRAAGVVLGGPRQLDLLPDEVRADRLRWPRPLRPAVAGLVAEHAGSGLVVLASGDPFHYGIGRALVEEVGVGRLDVYPHPSSISLACARLGWPVEDVDVLSAVGRDPSALLARLHEGRRLLVLSSGAATPAQVAGLLTGAGHGGSPLVVLGDLGAAGESRSEGLARDWGSRESPALNVIAVEPRRDPGAPRLGLTPGLPDDVFESDGQLTKSEVRAVALAALAPAPGELLWDVGAGTGTVGIEWMRAHPTCRAVAVEPRADRAARIAANATRLGVPALAVVIGTAPEALSGLDDAPDAIFVGGGLTSPGLLDACLAALRPGGRLVADAVTLESEAVLADAHARLGGRLVRLEIARAAPLGGFTGWVPARPVTQWVHHSSPAGPSTTSERP